MTNGNPYAAIINRCLEAMGEKPVEPVRIDLDPEPLSVAWKQKLLQIKIDDFARKEQERRSARDIKALAEMITAHHYRVGSEDPVKRLDNFIAECEEIVDVCMYRAGLA